MKPEDILALTHTPLPLSRSRSLSGKRGKLIGRGTERERDLHGVEARCRGRSLLLPKILSTELS